MREVAFIGRFSDKPLTATYLSGIAPFEVVNAISARSAPEGAS